MDWRCYFRHRWGEWSEPQTYHLYLRLMGGSIVHIHSEARAGPFDCDMGKHTLQTRWCERCKAQEQRRV